MKILDIKVMRGPNHWSSNHKTLIVLKIDINDVFNFSKKEKTRVFKEATDQMPFLFEKYPAETNEESEVALLIEHIALMLQSLAGMNGEFSSVRMSATGEEYYIIFSYVIEQAGIYAAKAAVSIVEALFENKNIDLLFHVDELKKIKTDYSIGATTAYLLEEIKKRNIPYRQLNYGSLITLNYGIKQRKIRTAVTDTTSGLGIDMAGNKEETKKILEQSHIPIPKGILIKNETMFHERLVEVKFPLVIKPLDGNAGRGVTTNINSLEKALFGFNIARKISDNVIIEEFIKGEDYRLLVIDYKFVAAAKRIPSSVTGNGQSTIAQLIEEENKNPERGNGDKHVLSFIEIDQVTEKILVDKKITLNDVLPAGEILILKDTANISGGGTAIDVTDLVHSENKFMAEYIARLFNLNICGIDIMATAIDIPFAPGVGAVIEVNAGPGLRMHSNPQEGLQRNVAAPIVDMLFPENQVGRIPVVAITGTNGNSDIIHLLAHLVKQIGFKPGYTSKNGIYIDGHHIYQGDGTDFSGTQNVLFDPLIDFAILECDNIGTASSGLGFDNCDISITLNINRDHLGFDAIYTPADQAKITSVIAGSTNKKGYAILNADEDQVYTIKKRLNCNIALFSTDFQNQWINVHCKNGGLAAFIENDFFIICKENVKTTLLKITDVTVLNNDKEMLKNVLAVILVGFINNFRDEDMVSSIKSFYSKNKKDNKVREREKTVLA
ncbi:MAG: ATP-grasp domain-containing protein [Bacteroidetes bacterium]|nr:ATP-grasp domain-containing protein [Bacteroidota bacterium]